MSTFDDASLVLIPSGYKTSKVYSVKPTDGTGDLTFTRSLDTATRVGPDGLIEKVRTNANINFQGWNKIDGSEVLTSGVVDPFGGTNAFNLSGLVAGNYDYGLVVGTTISVGANSNFTISIFAKGTGTIGITAQGAGFFTLLPITLTSTYARHTLTISPSSSISSFTFYVSNFTGSTATSADIAFPQAELGDIATPYIPTTTAAVSVGMLANVPRLDYLGGGCPRLLLEPQRTNIKTSSENATGWGNPISITTALNVATSPDGFVNADKIIETATTSNHRFDIDFSATSGTAYTLSYFAKAAERTQCHIHGYSDNLVFNLQTAIFNLSNGTIVSNTGGGIASIVDYGNGWYRVSLTLTAGATATGYWAFGVALNGATNYLGVATNGALFYGIQLELGSYPTSYIPTLGAAVTRSADNASKTGISALIGQTEGTIFVEFNSSNVVGADNIVFGLSTGSTLNRIIIFFGSNVNAQVRDAGVVQGTITGPVSTANTTFKCALAYNLNDVAFFVNGVLVGTITSATIPATSNVRFDGGAGAGGCDVPISQALVFKTRLSNAQLEELTA